MITDVISIRGVSKKFRHGTATSLKGFLLRDVWKKKNVSAPFWALKDVDLSIKKGSTFGIIGQNGSGKSTLLKIIAGILRPDIGDVTVQGNISALIELGAGFHPEFTGRENIYINGMLLGLTKKEIDKKVDEIIEFTGLKDFIDEPVRTYSSGMYSKLGFSVAVNVNPDILLIDEVFAVGDEEFAHKCKGKMDEFKRRGKTILLVTHDLTTVENWCDEVLWLDKGIVRGEGEAGRTIENYRLATHAKESSLPSSQGPEVVASIPEPSIPVEMTENKKRYGSKDIEIVKCRVLSGDGVEKNRFGAGEAMSIEMSYNVNKPVNDVIFGISIWKGDGSICCYGTNTYLEGIKIPDVKDSGKVIFSIEETNFIEGTYLLTISVHSKEGYTYDRHYQYYEFDVTSRVKDTGIYRPKHSWNFSKETDNAAAN